MNSDIKDLLERKAEEMQLGPEIPGRVLRRARRRRAVNAVLVSAVVAGLAAGAVLGVQAALNNTGTVPPPNQAAGQTATYEAWFTMDQHLFLSHSTLPEPSGPQDALEAMLRGPTDQDTAAGVTTAIPAGTELQTLSVQDGLARVQLSTHVESDPLSDAQVVYTLTQYPNIERVLINDQEGGPLSRDDLKDQLPAIVVQSPAIGDTVSSPITISGTADVFEATVSVRILDAAGNTVADTSTTATCGTGCRGDYTAQVEYSLPDEQLGTVEVYESSAENGQPINVVRIPVTLQPNTVVTPPTEHFAGIWPADSQSGLDQLQKEAAAGQADYALAPDSTAVQFAVDILHWNKNRIGVQDVQTGGDQSYVTLWNRDMGSSYSKDISLGVMLNRFGSVWIVIHAESGLFDLECPSTRQDVILDGDQQEICGQFAQPPAGWIVQAILMPAGNALVGGEAQLRQDIPVSGQRFDGTLPPKPNFDGADAELVVSVYSGSGETLGVWARRFITDTP